jgi:hypothetical protein
LVARSFHARAEARLARGDASDLSALLRDLAEPPISHIGALELDAFLPKNERRSLAAALNTLLASPTFASWRPGTALEVGAWLQPQRSRTPAVVVSVAHLDDDERALVLGVLLEELLTWVRSLPGTQNLRALVVFDEVFTSCLARRCDGGALGSFLGELDQAPGAALVSDP